MTVKRFGYQDKVMVISRAKKVYLINIELSGIKSMHKIGKKLARKKMEELPNPKSEVK